MFVYVIQNALGSDLGESSDRADLPTTNRSGNGDSLNDCNSYILIFVELGYFLLPETSMEDFGNKFCSKVVERAEMHTLNF